MKSKREVSQPTPLPQSSAVFIHQACTVDATVGDAAGTDQHAVACSTAEVTAAAHGAIILAFGAPELKTQPKAWGKVRCAQVTDERHLVGTGEQDLHAHVETDLSVTAG